MVREFISFAAAQLALASGVFFGVAAVGYLFYTRKQQDFGNKDEKPKGISKLNN